MFSNQRLFRLFVFACLLLAVCAPVALAQTAPPPSTSDNSGIVGGTIGLVCCGGFGLVMLAVGLYVLYFLYTDAEARGSSGVMWVLIGLLASWPVALIIWLIVRPEKKV